MKSIKPSKAKGQASLTLNIHTRCRGERRSEFLKSSLRDEWDSFEEKKWGLFFLIFRMYGE